MVEVQSINQYFISTTNKHKITKNVHEITHEVLTGQVICYVMYLNLIYMLMSLVAEYRNFHAHISLQCLSSLFLNALVDGASTTCCGNAFQVPTVDHSDAEDFRTVANLNEIAEVTCLGKPFPCASNTMSTVPFFLC